MTALAVLGSVVSCCVTALVALRWVLQHRPPEGPPAELEARLKRLEDWRVATEMGRLR